MADIDIVVMGASGVGKSTFIQQALGLRHTPSTLSVRKMSIEGVVHNVKLLECRLEQFQIASNKQFWWPSQVTEAEFHQVDGVLMLHDFRDPDNIAAVSKALDALVSASVPSVLVSCKSDSTPAPCSVDDYPEEVFSGVPSVQIAANAPDSQKRCIGTILGRVMVQRSGSSLTLATNHFPMA
ncbi:MAG: hypothetical protein M1817_002685 [Caeruleum heppii]|nr:MAG: hypothetical protein M1817_002685 [Caeruleum heppii]